MNKRLLNPASAAALALALLSGLALSACSPDPYPTPVAEEPPPPPPAELAGGPAYGPPPPPPPMPLPAPPPVAYEPAPQGPPVVIAMAPIPNPPEEPRQARRRAARRYETYSYAQARPARRHRAARGASAPARQAATPAARRPAPVHAARAATARPPLVVSKTPNKVTPPRAVAKAAKPPVIVSKTPNKVTPPQAVARGAKPAVPGGLKGPAAPKVAAGAAATAAATAPADSNAAVPSETRLAHIRTLETALKDAVQDTAKLNVPEHFSPGVAADVALTFPADFADTLKTEADKAGLGEAAKSANLTAVLSGEGYMVTPDETQSLPLAAGKPTEFHWAVTAAQNAKGPLKADVGADLLGGATPETLSLGSVGVDQGFWGAIKSPRLLVGAIIAILAALLIGWLARNHGGQPSRSAQQRRAARRAVRNDRPFDLGDEKA